MKRNIWYSVLVIAFVVFAVISAGGAAVEAQVIP